MLSYLYSEAEWLLRNVIWLSGYLNESKVYDVLASDDKSIILYMCLCMWCGRMGKCEMYICLCVYNVAE